MNRATSPGHHRQPGRSAKPYRLEGDLDTLDGIEQAVETFERQALPEVERSLLAEAQKRFIANAWGKNRESMITGESKPVPKGMGDKVVAGTVATDSSMAAGELRLAGRDGGAGAAGRGRGARDGPRVRLRPGQKRLSRSRDGICDALKG